MNDDLISRQAAIDAVMECYDNDELFEVYEWKLNELPPIQPTDNLQKLADEIASFKRRVKSDNSDYLTGYLCALSVVEGMIEDMREVNK